MLHCRNWLGDGWSVIIVVAVSLLRGINVGGRNKIRMADLRELYASLGFRNARTLLQSGNAVFETAESDMTLVGREIEAGIRRAFSLDIRVIMRSAAEFEAVLQRHPFSAEHLREARKVAVVFLSDAPTADALTELRASNTGPEIIHADGCELYIFYTEGMARSKLDNKRIERHLRLVSTARNWNTCLKLRKLLSEAGN